MLIDNTIVLTASEGSEALPMQTVPQPPPTQAAARDENKLLRDREVCVLMVDSSGGACRDRGERPRPDIPVAARMPALLPVPRGLR